jgi:hypothetical protein
MNAFKKGIWCPRVQKRKVRRGGELIFKHSNLKVLKASYVRILYLHAAILGSFF